MIKEFYIKNINIGKKEFVKIYIDSALFTTITNNSYKILKLDEEEKLDLDLLIQHLEKNEIKEVKNIILRYIARADYFEKDLRLKLSKKGYIGYCQDKAIEDIKNLGYINDIRIANNLVYFYKNKSKKFLESKLREKGLSEDNIYNIMLEFNENDDNLKIQVEKYSARLDLNNFKEYQKTINYFLRKGFEFNKIKRIVNEIKEKTQH